METKERTEDIKGTTDSDRTDLEKLEEERLQHVAEVVSRRKRYPKQCVEYLSKTMEIKLNALKKSSVEIPDPGPYTVNKRSFPKEVHHMADDQADLRIRIDRSSREINDLTRSFQELESILKIIRNPRNVLMYERLKSCGTEFK